VSRNPAWVRDELIIALDLYLRLGQLDNHDPEVKKVSALLNALPIHPWRPDPARFRNASGVALKLANFAALDPQYGGRGMSRGGKQDAAVWDELAHDPSLVRALAEAIKATVAFASEVAAVPAEGEEEAAEGRLLYRLHRARERDRSIVNAKKAAALEEGNALECEVCTMNFAHVYGPLGQDYIEVHHRVPLSVTGPTKTKLADLALICSNCHRMIHRSKSWLTVAELTEIVRAEQHRKGP